MKPVCGGQNGLALGKGRDNYDGSYKIDTGVLLNISTTFALYKN